MTGALPPLRLRALPRTVAPLHRESQDSYIERLATANRIIPAELLGHLTDPQRIRPGQLPLPVALAQLAAQPTDRLLLALPDLRTPELAGHLPPACRGRPDPGWMVQPQCRLCLAAKGIRHARHWVPPGTKMCARHHRWTGAHGQQFDVAPLPEIAEAQRRHHRLIGRLGWQDTDQGMREAAVICWTWWDSRRFRQGLDRRRTLLHAPNWSGAGGENLTLAACAYPDVVALADLLASPVSRSWPFTGNLRDMTRFLDEVRARVAPDYRPGTIASTDPLELWIESSRHTLADQLQRPGDR